MNLKKAVITAAGKNQRTLPLQSLVDSDGITKTALAIIIEEALAAGVEEVAIVIQPGDQTAYATAAGPHANTAKREDLAPFGSARIHWPDPCKVTSV